MTSVETFLRATHRQVLAPSLGRPQPCFGPEDFPQVQILENRSASAKPLRETPPPCYHLQSNPEPRRSESIPSDSCALGTAPSRQYTRGPPDLFRGRNGLRDLLPFVVQETKPGGGLAPPPLAVRGPVPVHCFRLSPAVPLWRETITPFSVEAARASLWSFPATD